MVARCAEDNKEAIDQSVFWDENGFNWDSHRIGWAIAGGCAVVTVIITFFSVLGHARHYHVRAEQRQIIRILYMPPVFAIVSFLSYRFFREYTYYSLVEIIYESFTLSAFIMLLIQYVASTATNNTAESALLRKDKLRLPCPVCCWRYRPTKPYFMYTVKWSVLQYTIIRPAASVAGIITQYYGLLCESDWSGRYAAVYIEAVDFVSISIALMGLIVFYDLTRAELDGRRPLAKFLCIKLIVMVTFYQGFVFSALQSRGYIKETEFWTSTNVADGLGALATCAEMVIFAAFMMWAYPSKEYRSKGVGTTSIWRPLLDSINFSDFAYEIWTSIKFFLDYFGGKPHTRGAKDHPGGTNFATAFGIEPNTANMWGSGSDDQPHPLGHNTSGMQRIKEQRSNASLNPQSPHFHQHHHHHHQQNESRMGEAYPMQTISTQPGRTTTLDPRGGDQDWTHAV